MRIQGFRGNCDSQASWGCAPALPNQIQVVFLGELLLGIPIFSVRQKGVPPLLLPATCFRLPTILSPYITKNRHRNFFRFHDGFSSTLSLLLIHIEETEPSRISCKMFIQRCPIRESRVIHREIRGFQGAGICIGTACYNNIVRTAIHII